MIFINKVQRRDSRVVGQFKGGVSLAVETENISVSAAKSSEYMRFWMALIDPDGDDVSLEDVGRCYESIVTVLVGVHIENFVASSREEKSVEIVNASCISLMSLDNPTQFVHFLNCQTRYFTISLKAIKHTIGYFIPQSYKLQNATLYRVLGHYNIRMRKYLKDGQYSIDESDVLGKGSFGKVLKGYDHTNSRWVAIKTINLELLEIYGKEMKNIICNEITVMRKFTSKMLEKPCPYLVKHYDCFRTDTHVYIVMELCQGGTLHDFSQKNVLKEDQVKKIVKQILKGLEYLNELNITHRDLKTDNIFISEEFENGKSEIYYKIGDFGFAAQKQTFKEVLGTYPFMAPEIFNRQDYTSKVDVWSLGATIYLLLFQELYFNGKNKWEIQKKVKQTPFFLTQEQKKQISPEMQEFIAMCLCKDQNKRPSVSELLSAPLFTKEYMVIFEAIQHELLYSQLLRTMAQQICEYGIATNHSSEFIQIYLLKKAYSGMNLLTYSLANQQNYLNVPGDMFQVLIGKRQSKEFNQLLERVQKENILITTGFQSKYEEFCKYISKFSQTQQQQIKNVLRAEEVYSDINHDVFKPQLSRWIKLLSQDHEYENLRLKCEKLLQL